MQKGGTTGGERDMKGVRVMEPVAQGAGLLEDARAIIEAARTTAYRVVNAALVQRNWLLGKRIAEEGLKGEGRAEYGKGVVKELAEKLTAEYGAGFDFGSLYKYVQFYRLFPILETLSPKSGGLLSWSHYFRLLQVESDEARRWYLDDVELPVHRQSRDVAEDLFDLGKGRVQVSGHHDAFAVAGNRRKRAMTDPLLEEVYRAREKLWQRGGGTLRGMGEYLRECGRRAKERGVLWIESEEEREAIGAEVRARLAREDAEGEWKDATAVGEERERYGAARSEKGKEKSEQRVGERFCDPTMQRPNEPTSDEVTR